MSLVFPQELTSVNQVTRAKFRPLKWRAIVLPEQNVPTWARFVEDRRIREFVGDPVAIDNRGANAGLPSPAFSVSKQTKGLYSFGYSHEYSDDEVAEALQCGIQLPTEQLSALTRGAETFLDRIAAEGLAEPGLEGLGTLPDVTPVTAITKAATGTTWAVATALEIYNDLVKLVNACPVATKETSAIDTIVMPLAQYQLANAPLTSALERTPLQLFRQNHPQVSRILVWDRLGTGNLPGQTGNAGLGAGNTPCIIGFDSTDDDGPRMLLPRELTQNQPVRTDFGWKIASHLKTGGVICRNQTAIMKMSGL